MIKTVFQWLDLHPGSYWVFALAGTLLLFARIAAVVRRETRPSTEPSPASWLDAGILLIFLFAWRWPFLLVADEFNPDESQLIAGGLTLVHDPVFWRAVDGGTAGPLDFYALSPLYAAGLPPDYFTARFIGLLWVAGALFICIRSTSRNGATAWLGVLPAAAFFATVTHADFIHLSTEHLPLLLTTASFALLATRAPDDRRRLWAALFIAGCAPWAKLQVVPLAVMLIGWGAWQVLRAPGLPLRSRVKRAFGAALWAVTPTLLIAGMAAATGQLAHGLRRYFGQNLIYVGQNHGRPLAEVWIEIKNAALLDGRFPLFLAVTGSLIVAGRIWFLRHRAAPATRTAAAAWLTFAAIVAVATPRREFLHYLLLVVMPLALWLSATVDGWWNSLATARARRGLALGVALLGGIVPVATRCLQPVPPIYGDFTYHWQHPRSSAAVVISHLAGDRGSIGVWGWANPLYVETARRQGIRDASSLFSIMHSPQRDYYRSVYLADFSRNAPEVFVDAVGPGAFVFNDRARDAHETFPALSNYVRTHYVLVADLAEMRIYARRDLPRVASLDPGEVDRLISQGRLASPLMEIVPPRVPLAQYTQKIIARRNVVMLLPPAHVAWDLDAEVRQVTLEFGIDPVAYLQGTTNGAEVILEVVSSSGQAREVYRRLVDPARAPGDRKPQTATVTLPPFGADSHLVLRTTAGPGGDSAWDWLYLATLRLHRHPTFLAEQFPGFDAVPVAADTVTPGTVDGDPGPKLLMHAPASISYALDGQSRLRFGYGFQPGAYADGGNTDGAILRVALQISGQPDRVLFERELDPVRVPTDRGPQRLDLALPAAPKGARLQIHFNPGAAGNAAWDWTYLGNLTLK